MELVETIEKRASVRSFKDEPVPEETVNEMLRLAQLAPSAGNLQARDFVVVRDQSIKAALATSAFGQEFLSEAPVCVVFCANLTRIRNYGARGVSLYCIQDTAAAVENSLLYLTAAGYASCWVGAFDEREVSKTLGLPDDIRPMAILPIGRPRDHGRRTPRLKLETLVHREKW